MIDDDMRQHDIMVYPESVEANPLKFQNVVRYVLFYPGYHGAGEKEYHPSELIFTAAKAFYDAPVLQFRTIDTSLFFDEKLPKLQDCYFVHKGGKWRNVPEIEGLLEINKDYPKTHEELAYLLKTTGILYSFDDKSALTIEAVLCGAKVKIITEDGFSEISDEDVEEIKERVCCIGKHEDLLEKLERQLDDFIAITQKMNYTGRIQQYPIAVEKFLASPKKRPESSEDYLNLARRVALLKAMQANNG